MAKVARQIIENGRAKTVIVDVDESPPTIPKDQGYVSPGVKAKTRSTGNATAESIPTTSDSIPA